MFFNKIYVREIDAECGRRHVARRGGAWPRRPPPEPGLTDLGGPNKVLARHNQRNLKPSRPVAGSSRPTNG